MKRIKYYILVINFSISFFLGILAYLFVPDIAFDTYRYYENALYLQKDLDVFAFVGFNFLRTFDFIYYLLQYFCIAFEIPIQFLTGISVGFLYFQSYQILEIINLNSNLKIKSFNYFVLSIVILFSVSFITVFSIGRNVTAFMFFSFALKYLLLDKKKLSILYLIFSLFTHIGLILYLVIFYIGFYFPAKRIKYFYKIIASISILLFLTSQYFIGVLFSVLDALYFLKSDYNYNKYLEITDFTNVFGFTLGLGDKVMMISTSVLLLFSFFFIRDKKPIVTGGLFLFLWLMTSMGFSQMYVQRTLLILIPFQGIIGFEFMINNKNKNIVMFYYVLVFISFLSFIWNVYSYRGLWIFENPS